MPNDTLGNRGEDLAAHYLRQRGMKILVRNYHSPVGEIDIIALDKSSDGETIVFIEVKTRKTDNFAEPASAIDAHKRRQLIRTAQYYLTNHDADDYNARFDIVSIVIADGNKPIIKYIPDAF